MKTNPKPHVHNQFTDHAGCAHAGWRCIRCGHDHDRNPRCCDRCEFTVLAPLWTNSPQPIEVPYTVEVDEDGVWCAHAQLRTGVGAHGQGASEAEAICDLRQALSGLTDEVRPGEIIHDDAPSAATPTADLFTFVERHALGALAEVVVSLTNIIGHGETRRADMTEAVHHVHALQNMILAQAAARAYPDRYRLLGSALNPQG